MTGTIVTTSRSDEESGVPSNATPPSPGRPPRWRLAVGVLLAACTVGGAVYVSGNAEFFSLKTIGLNYEALRRVVDEHFAVAALCYVGGYGLLGLLMLPGSAVVVVLSGLLFGAKAGIALAMAGSALATLLPFMLARLTFGSKVGAMSGPVIERLRVGFNRHALSYLMFLRLTPGLPFAVINVAPALLGMPVSTFAFATLAGLLPSRIALSTAGAGLGSIIGTRNLQYSQCLAANPAEPGRCLYDLDIASLLTKETLAAFVALAVLALVPVIMDAAPRIWKRFGSKRDADV